MGMNTIKKCLIMLVCEYYIMSSITQIIPSGTNTNNLKYIIYEMVYTNLRTEIPCGSQKLLWGSELKLVIMNVANGSGCIGITLKGIGS